MIICAGQTEVFDFAEPVGVGLVESAVNLTKLIVSRKPEELAFIGSAGSYGGLDILELVLSCEAVNIEHSAVYKSGYSPLELRESTFLPPKQGRKTVVINSSNYITTSAETSRKLSFLGVDAENMEFYSILRTAREFGIPVFGVFVVTNYCNKDAHQEYLQNLPAAKRLLIDYCKKELKI
jgi:nucleoside phosphorylase